MPAVTAAISSAVAWLSAASYAFAVAYPIAFAALNIAVSIGLSYVVNALTPKPKPDLGMRGQMRAGGALERSFPVGTCMTAGSLAYANTHTKINDFENIYLVYVVQVSDLPTTSLDEVWCNGSKVTWNPAGSSTEPTFGVGIPEFKGTSDGNPADYLFIKYYDGNQITADPYLVAKFGSDPKLPWTSNFIGKGCSYVIVTARLNPKLWSGYPTFKFVVKGAKLYDQRKDSTAGGSGAHRYDNPTTWEWTDNEMVIANHIKRGIKYNGQHFYGLQNTSVNRLPAGSWFAAMNECDALVNDSGGNPVRQYRCGGEIPVNLPPADVLEELAKACNARYAEIAGSYKVLVGAAAASVYSFTDADILVNHRQSLDQFPSLGSLVNGIAATYPEPAEGWNKKDAPVRKNLAAMSEDERELIANVDYNWVPYADQVQRLMASALKEARKFARVQHVLPPTAWALEPNDTVTWTSARNGYTAKTFRIEAMDDTDDLDIPVQLVECDPADYTFNPGTDYFPNPTTPPPQSQPPTTGEEPVGTQIPGTRADGIEFNDGAINAGSTAFTSLTSTFTPNDVGKAIYILGAGAAGETLLTSIATYTSVHLVQVTAAAGTTVTGAHGYYGTDEGDELAEFFEENEGGVNTLGHNKIYLSSRALQVKMKKLEWNGCRIVFGIPNHTDNCLEIFKPTVVA